MRAPLSVSELDALAADGRARAGVGHELVAGVLLAAPPPSAAVLRAVADLAAALERAAPDHRVLVREAVVLGPHDLLRPEVALARPVGAPAAARGRAAAERRWPGVALALAVFVGDDEAPLRWRAHRCARGGVREVWTLAVGERRASRWRMPYAGRYAAREAIAPGEAVHPDALPEQAVVAWR